MCPITLIAVLSGLAGLFVLVTKLICKGTRRVRGNALNTDGGDHV